MSEQLGIDDVQKHFMESAIYPKDHFSLAYTAIGLAGEAGEVCNEVKRMIRDDGSVLTESRKAAILAELGDVLWYLAAVAGEAGFKLSDVALAQVEKLEKRKQRETE
jgi:NTP pyrophosphatase (non-canonical NTP hydrolase)